MWKIAPFLRTYYNQLQNVLYKKQSQKIVFCNLNVSGVRKCRFYCPTLGGPVKIQMFSCLEDIGKFCKNLLEF